MRTLLYLAKTCLMDIGEDDSRLEQFIHYSYWGYREFYLDQGHRVKIHDLELNQALEAEVPEDFVDWVSVYVEEAGMKKTFIHSSQVALQEGYPKPRGSAIGGNYAQGGVAERSYAEASGYAGPVFPAAVAFSGKLRVSDRLSGYRQRVSGSNRYYGSEPGYFRCDYDRGVIAFNPTEMIRGNRVMMEYLSNDEKNKGGILVHEYAAGMVRAYIHWQRKLHGMRFSGYEKQEAKRLYDNEYQKVRDRFSPLTIKGVMDALAAGYNSWK